MYLGIVNEDKTVSAKIVPWEHKIHIAETYEKAIKWDSIDIDIKHKNTSDFERYAKYLRISWTYLYMDEKKNKIHIIRRNHKHNTIHTWTKITKPNQS